MNGAGISRSGIEKLAECLCGDVSDRSDWDEVIATANDLLLGPYLYRRILTWGHLERVDPEVVDYLGSQTAANRERSRRLLAQLDEVASAMNAAGVVPLVIKGMAALAQMDQVERFPRIIRDVDLLIDKDQAETADAALLGLGYGVERIVGEAHSIGNYARGDAVGIVDLHIRLPRRIGIVVAAEDLRTRVRDVRLSNSVVRVPDPTLQIAINLAHDMIHNIGIYSGVVDLGYLIELIEFIDERGGEIEWSWIERKQKSRRFDLSLELQARMARRLFKDSPFPTSRISALGWALHQRRRLKARFASMDRWDSMLFDCIFSTTRKIPGPPGMLFRRP